MNITVERVETFVVRLPPRADFRWLSLSRPLGEFILCRVEGDDQVGWGEVVGLRDWGDRDGRRHGETPATVTSVVHDQLAPGLLGHAVSLGALPARLDELIIGHPYAKALLDIALHDLVGRSCGVPVYTLLGGAVRDSVPVAHMLGLMPVEEALAEARRAVNDGVRALQIKGGGDVARDCEVVRELRAEHGDDLWLRLDANAGYRGRARARHAIGALADAGADLIEQPLLGVLNLAELRRDSPVALMADEACWSPADALDLVARRAVDVLSVYVGKAGGLARAREVCAIAHAAELPHDLNGALELGIGNAANWHLAVASPAELLPSVIPVNAPAGAFPTTTAGRYFDDDVVKAPWSMKDGNVRGPHGPGLGVEVDEEKIRHYCDQRRATSTNLEVADG
ncbi:MAG: mandelate racemase/muconate lactonizing enzyme family protein [Solirubrobacteraceae bacterium]